MERRIREKSRGEKRSGERMSGERRSGERRSGERKLLKRIIVKRRKKRYRSIEERLRRSILVVARRCNVGGRNSLQVGKGAVD